MHLPYGRTLRRVVSPLLFGCLLFVFENCTDRLALERSYNTLIKAKRETIKKLHSRDSIIGQNVRLQLWNSTLLVICELDADLVEAEPRESELFDTMQHIFPESENRPARKNVSSFR